VRNFLRLPAAPLVAALLTISSCTTMESEPGDTAEASTVEGGAATAITQPAPASSGLIQSTSQVIGQAESVLPSEPTFYRGTDQLVRMPEAKKPIRLYGEDVTLNFEQAPLTEVVHAIMGDILELDYIVEHPINGEVTLRTRSPVPRDQLLDILESLLKANSALMIRDADGRFFVSGSGQMSRLKPSVAASASDVAGFSTIIIPLQYVSASSMADILRPVAEEAAFVRIDDMRNILILAGTRAQLSGWQELITTFDVDLLKGMSVGIFPIENSSIEEIDSALGSLLGKGEGAEGMAEGLAGIGSVVRIIPMPRLSSILVITPRAHYLKRIGTWIKRLDQEPDSNYERRLYVYEVQNSSASHLAELLSSIYGGGGSGSKGSGGVAPGLTPEKVSSSGGSNGGANGSGAKKKSSGSTSSNFSVGEVKVVADEENNALLIYATGKEYRKMEPALRRLDVAATQVIIEASIIEVTLTDTLEYGLEWAFDIGLSGGDRGIGVQASGSSPAPKSPGFSYSVINASGDIRAALNAFAEEGLLNVISSPSVMVLDNHTATIQVGDQVPVSTGSTTNEVGTTQTISFKDTGVQLSVTPSVNAGGMVTMDIDQSVTDVGPLDASAGGTNRSFLERKITSRVAVRSTESVVLGGLIRENKSENSSGIPILHSIPLIGPLFGTKATTGSRTELLVVITPRAIYNDSELRDVSREMRKQMRGLDLIDVSDSSAFLHDPRTDTKSDSDQ
jgi:general secretion pathway protein D